VHADEIVFTGSATESANLALFGAVRAWQKEHLDKRAHVIVSAIEHDAVLEPARRLREEGVRVSEVAVGGDGVVDLAALKEMICEETVVISIMYANNEVGTVEPIKEIAKIIRKWKKETRGVTRDGKPEGDERYPLFHTDACQAANYCDMNIPRLGVDLMTLNAAKVYGPKGIGLLYRSREVLIEAQIIGGGHERGLRAGTENVPAVVGFACALTGAREIAEEESVRLSNIRDHAFLELEKIPGLVINGSKTARLPNNIHFSIHAVDHEFLALALDARGFAVATKSACNEFDADTSHVLLALRNEAAKDLPISGIRLSLGRSTTKEDIDAFTAALKDILATMIINI